MDGDKTQPTGMRYLGTTKRYRLAWFESALAKSRPTCANVPCSIPRMCILAGRNGRSCHGFILASLKSLELRLCNATLFTTRNLLQLTSLSLFTVHRTRPNHPPGPVLHRSLNQSVSNPHRRSKAAHGAGSWESGAGIESTVAPIATAVMDEEQ